MPRVDRWLDALEHGPEVSSPGPVGAAVRLFNEGTSLVEAFDTLLSQLQASHAREMTTMDGKRAALDKKEEDLRDEFIHAMLQFLHRSNPGFLTPQARDILKNHALLLKSLRLTTDELADKLARFE